MGDDRDGTTAGCGRNASVLTPNAFQQPRNLDFSLVGAAGVAIGCGWSAVAAEDS